MTSIGDIIKREVNPFDLINLKPGNFWGEQQDPTLMVQSIHQEAIAEIEGLVDLIARDHRSRSILLLGDSGSGKSYLLGRLKQTLNSKAFFAYIGPWVDSNYIWRHTLRYTVDSLTQVPEGQQESQLMLWLQSLSAFTKRNDNIWNILKSDRQKFIKHLKQTYKQAGIYNPDMFFGVLHDLTNPDLYDLACEWLKGDNLSEESMQELKVRYCIDTEEDARGTLANFGRISTATQPIVLCFDNLDNIPKLPDGSQDFQALFNVNTTIHNENLKNFLVIVSVITNTLKLNAARIQQADRARIDKQFVLKRISLEQALALWAYRLRFIHSQVKQAPNSAIFPLTKQILEQSFPGGKTTPREALNVGKLSYQKYKESLINVSKNQPTQPQVEIEKPVTPEKKTVPPPPDTSNKIQAEFELLWQQDFQKIQKKITRIPLLSAPELIKMLQETLTALQVQGIKLKLLTGNYASYSLSYQKKGSKEIVGVVWTEDPGMGNLYHVMNASQKALYKKSCQKLQLIRAATLGKPNLAGYQIYQQIFSDTHHQHIKPSLSSVHYLATYHSLVNAALASELVVAGKTLSLQELESLIRESNILQRCTLLQDLGIIAKSNTDSQADKLDLQLVQDFLLNLVITQQFMGRPTLVKNAIAQFSDLDRSQIDPLINQLCQSNKIEILNPEAKPEDQTVCLVVR